MITVQTASRKQKAALSKLMQLYLHDLSEFDGFLPDPSGSYATDPYFDRYWIEPQRHPYLIYHDSTPIGFALVRELAPDIHSIAEFFILRSARGKGNAPAAANILFDMHPGEWHIAQPEKNIPAQAFWKSVITKRTNGDYEETWSNALPIGPKQIFKTTIQPANAADSSCRPNIMFGTIP